MRTSKIKQQLFIYFLLLNLFTNAQNRINPHKIELDYSKNFVDYSKMISNDTNIDVHFYHLNLDIEIDYEYLQGNVNFLMSSNVDGLNNIKLDLDDAFIIDSISDPVANFTFQNNVISINFSQNYDVGEQIAFSIYYHGVPVLAGGYKGLRYETHHGGQPIIASLSTPYLAHTWWPCKDGTEDKADSVFIDITVKDTIIASLPVIVVSNGLLDTVISTNGKKTFKWKHFYPIVTYYVMVAISNYEHFQQIYQGTGYNFPIDYYVFASDLTISQNGVAEIPEVFDFFTDIFGTYPFYQEKYGMTQLGYYGAIENQTNTIINNMGLDWFYVSVHELAHMWFADMITCTTWHHGWLNEGFASYAEALYAEHQSGFAAYQSYMTNFEYYNSGTVYMSDISNPFNIFQTIIYDKGAYVLHMLRGVLGDDVFFDAIKQYATDDSFAYKNASTEDFMNICENVSGQDLEYFFEQWIYDEYYPTYRYNFNQSNEDLEIFILQSQGNQGWRELFIMPIEIDINFTDGTDTLVRVFNHEKFETFDYSFTKTVNSIVIDPDNWILKSSQYDPTVGTEQIEVENQKWNVSPNPSFDDFSIKFEDNFVYMEKYIQIFDINGRVVFENTIEDYIECFNVDTDIWEAGIYFILLNVESKLYYKKIVIIKK